MRLHYYFIPVFASTQLISQTEKDVFHQVGFGVTHSAFSHFCFQQETKPLAKIDRKEKNSVLSFPESPFITENQTGFCVGFFNDLPLNNVVVLRTLMEGSYSVNYKYQNANSVFYSSFGFKIKPSLNIAITKANPNGIIYLARNMSCYLTYKQPYISVTPILYYQKFDAGYLKKGFNNEMSFGASVGYGINYEFHGTNFGSEICYQVSTSSKQKLYHGISLLINVF